MGQLVVRSVGQLVGGRVGGVPELRSFISILHYIVLCQNYRNFSKTNCLNCYKSNKYFLKCEKCQSVSQWVGRLVGGWVGGWVCQHVGVLVSQSVTQWVDG